MHTLECFFVEFTRHLKHACRPLANNEIPLQPIQIQGGVYIDEGVIEEEEGGDLINAFYQHHKSIQEKIKNELKAFHEKEQKIYRPFIRGLRAGTFVPAPNFDFVEDIIGGTYTVEDFFTNLDIALEEAKGRNPPYGSLLERRINELKRYVENYKTDSEKMAAAKRILQAITANTSNSKISVGIISWGQQNPWAKIQTCSNTLYFSTSDKKLTNKQIHQLLEHCQQGYGAA